MSKKYNNPSEFWEDTKGDDTRTYEELPQSNQANQETKLSAYNKKNFLEETYGNALKELDQSKYNQQRAAYFQNQKLLKYLPENLKRQGLAGLGISNQAYLDASNNYNNTLANINSEYNSNKTSLLNDYNKNMLEIEENERDKITENNRYFDQQSGNTSSVMQSYFDANVPYLLDEDGKLSYENDQKLQEYYKANEKNLNESDRSLLKSYLDSINRNYTMNEDGSYTTKNADGSITTTNKDGSYSVTTTDSSGVKTTKNYDKDGKEISSDRDVTGAKYPIIASGAVYNNTGFFGKHTITYNGTKHDFNDIMTSSLGNYFIEELNREVPYAQEGDVVLYKGKTYVKFSDKVWYEIKN